MATEPTKSELSLAASELEFLLGDGGKAIYPAEADRRKQAVIEVEKLLQANIPARARFLDVCAAVKVKTDATPMTWPTRTTGGTQAGRKTQMEQDWVTLGLGLKLFAKHVDAMREAQVDPTRSPGASQTTPPAASPQPTQPATPGEPPAKRVRFDPTKFFGSTPPPKQAPKSIGVTGTELQGNNALQNAVNGVLSGQEADPSTYGGASGDSYIVSNKDTLSKLKDSIKSVKNGEHIMLLKKDGTVGANSVWRPTQPEFVEKQVSILLDESIPRSDRALFGANLVFMCKMVSNHNCPWWVVYDWHAGRVQKVIDGDSRISFDPALSSSEFFMDNMSHLAQALRNGGGGGGGGDGGNGTGNRNGGGDNNGKKPKCTGFNAGKCTFPNCRFLHECSKCNSKKHGANTCHQGPKK